MVKTLIATLAFAVTATVMAPVAAQADYYDYDWHARWRQAHYEHMRDGYDYDWHARWRQAHYEHMRWRQEHYRHMYYGY